jgi:hypothetical protein
MVQLTNPLARREAHLRDRVYGRVVPHLMKKFGTVVEVYRTTEREHLVPVEATTDHLSDAMKQIADATRSVYALYDTVSQVQDVPDGLIDDDGTEPNVMFTVRMLIGHALFTPTDDQFAGDFNDNTVVCEQPLLPGDRFQVQRTDGTIKAWKILQPEVVGATTVVYTRYRVGSIGSTIS